MSSDTLTQVRHQLTELKQEISSVKSSLIRKYGSDTGDAFAKTESILTNLESTVTIIENDTSNVLLEAKLVHLQSNEIDTIMTEIENESKPLGNANKYSNSNKNENDQNPKYKQFFELEDSIRAQILQPVEYCCIYFL